MPFCVSAWHCKEETLEIEPDPANDNFHGKFTLPGGLYVCLGFLCWELSIDMENK